MKKRGIFLGILVLVGIVAFLSSAQSGYGKQKPGAVPEKMVPLKKCCIAGDYDGTYSAACPLGIDPPAFYMYIIQANCGSKIDGRLEACNDVYQLSGTVTRADKCCKVVGELKGVPGNPTEGKIARIEFIICKDARGKWYTNNGVYKFTAGRDCGGTFTINQR